MLKVTVKRGGIERALKELKNKFIKKNITLSKIPDINQKIYFDEEKIYIVIDVIHYYNNGVQVIWLIVKNFNEQTPTEILTDK